MKQIFQDKKTNVLFAAAGVGILVIAFAAAIFSNGPIPTPIKFYLNLRQSPSSQPGPTVNGCELIPFNPKVNTDIYNTVGSLDFVSIKEPDKILEIAKDGSKRTISLGRFELPLETYTILQIPKFWLYFSSDVLSDRSDKLYGLEDSYLSAIVLKVGDKSQEIKLSKTGEHAFLEIDNCPLGNIYPLKNETALEFEIILEIACNNLKDGVCLDNSGKSLDYIDGADLTAAIRVFAVSYQSFTKDITIPLSFKYK